MLEPQTSTPMRAPGGGTKAPERMPAMAVAPPGSAPYWTDAALHALAGTPAVVYGPVGDGLHEDLEWVSTDGLRRSVAALTGLARSWCAPR